MHAPAHRCSSAEFLNAKAGHRYQGAFGAALCSDAFSRCAMGTSDGGMIRQEKGMMMMNANNSRRPVDKTSMPLTSETSAQDAAWREARDELPASCRREVSHVLIV